MPATRDLLDWHRAYLDETSPLQLGRATHARRKTFPAFSDIAAVLPEVWPWGEMAEVAEVASRLSHQFPQEMVEAAIWSSTPSLARFLWPCSHRMLQCLCPHLCLTRFCLNQSRRGWLRS